MLELAKEEPLTQTPVIPSAVCILDPKGNNTLIGQEAVNYNWDGSSSGFAQGFKLPPRHGVTHANRLQP